MVIEARIIRKRTWDLVLRLSANVSFVRSFTPRLKLVPHPVVLELGVDGISIPSQTSVWLYFFSLTFFAPLRAYTNVQLLAAGL